MPSAEENYVQEKKNQLQSEWGTQLNTPSRQLEIWGWGGGDPLSFYSACYITSILTRDLMV